MIVVDLSANLETALALARSGLAVFPCHSGGDKAKQPMPFIKWREASTTDEATIRSWWRKWPGAAPALDLAKCGLLVIDADRHGEHDGVEAFGQLMIEHGFNPDTAPLVATPNAGNHHFFRQPTITPLGNGRGSLPPGIDVRGAGGYVVAPGAVMQDGRFYELFGNLEAAPPIPEWLIKILTGRRDPPSGHDTVPAGPTSSSSPDSDEIAELLSHIDPDCSYHDWVSVLMAVHAETGGTGFDLVDQWSARGQKYPGLREMQRKWASFKRGGITGRTLAEIARLYGADLSAIAIKYRGTPHFDPVEKAEAAWRLIERHDGVLADAETGEIVEMASELPTPLLDYPAGLVGEIAKWIVATSRRQQPELAIGAALAIVGTVAGRQFAGPTLSGTHLYILGLAPTGKGKDHGLQQIGRIMAAANMGIHLGPSEFISMPAVVNFLVRKPLSLCAMDEFGGFMKRINSKRASGFESSISKILRTMWSSSFAPYQTPEWAQKESQTIFAPSMTLYGASTPEQFYGSMESASLEDGTLNRFLIMRGRDKAPEREPEMEAAKVPEWIVHGLKKIYFSSGEMAATWRNDSGVDPAAHDAVKILPWCPDGAEDRYREFSHEIERRIEQEPDAAAFHARAVEMAIRIATIVAIGRMEDMAVRKADLEFGISVAMASAKIMVEGAADYMAENENQANAHKIMRIIKGRGGRIKYRDLLRALCNSIKARDLKDILAFMCEAGQLERQEVKQDKGGWPEIWYSKP